MRHMTSLCATKFQVKVKWDGTKFHPTEMELDPQISVTCVQSSEQCIQLVSSDKVSKPAADFISYSYWSWEIFSPFFTELIFTISSWFEHSHLFFFSFQKVVFYASIHLCRAGGFWLWSWFMTSKKCKKLFRFMSLQAKGKRQKSILLPYFSCIQETSKEI